KLALITIEPISTISFPHDFGVIPSALFNASSLKYDHKTKEAPISPDERPSAETAIVTTPR
ncbi:MAG: hypothetical protein IIZ12_07910, partial [Eggerthellaceae bacterium]|nr:hypothetical protein [Eggerthellaceae bacterium]